MTVGPERAVESSHFCLASKNRIRTEKETMPLYEYKCTACHKHTEKIQKFSDPEITACPHCGGTLERVLSAPAVNFKGGGWYADGYGNAKPKSSDGASKAGSDSKHGTDSKSSNDSKPAKDGASAATPAAPATAAASASSSDKK
jgi:putative FmdB family regulatory protein